MYSLSVQGGKIPLGLLRRRVTCGAGGGDFVIDHRQFFLYLLSLHAGRRNFNPEVIDRFGCVLGNQCQPETCLLYTSDAADD